MANTIASASMAMPIPVVGTDPGPQWATDVNSCFAIIDTHNHAPGSGVAINPDGLDINTDLSFSGNNATQLRSTRFTAQLAPLALAADVGCLYESGVDLYYNDGAGNQIRMTQSGGIAGTPGSISGLTSPAAAIYVSADQTFVWQSNTLTPANMDAGSYIFRNITANSKGLTLNPPLAMGADYSLTLPALPASTSVMTLTAAGAMGTVPAIQTQQGTLAPRSAANPATAGNFAKTALSSGAFTTSSLTPVDVTNLSVTLTTTGRPVWLGLVSSDDVLDGFSSLTLDNSNAGEFGQIRFVETGGPTSVFFTQFNFRGVPAMYTLSFVAAGTYTWKVQLNVNTGSQIAGINYFKFVAYEL